MPYPVSLASEGKYGQNPSNVTNKIARDKIKNKKDRFTVGTLNVRTLKSSHDLMELENAFMNSTLKILGISEVRRKYETNMTTKNSNKLYHTASTKGEGGVGFIIKSELKDNRIKLYIGKNCKTDSRVGKR